MTVHVRLCFAVECTARLSPLWVSVIKGAIEPLLAHYGSMPGLELAVVLFGAHPPQSLATVESSFGWLRSLEQFWHLVDELEFMGGGAQPVVLAEALLEVASLFAAPEMAGGPAAAEQHCLVCLASEPSINPVPWPIHEDCCMARLPGLATSVELCRALCGRGIQLGFAGGGMLSSTPLLWHIANLASDMPLSLAEAKVDQLKQRQDGTLQRLLGCAATLPGGAMVVLPSWPQALEVVIKAGGKPLPSSSALTAGSKSLAGGLEGGAGGVAELALGTDSLELLPCQTHDPTAKRARLGAASCPLPAAAGVVVVGPGAGAPASPGDAAAGSLLPGAATMPPGGAMLPQPPQQQSGVAAAGGMQWMPPVAAEPSPPLSLATKPTPPLSASPGSFLEVLNAEILMSPEDASPMQDSMMTAMMQQAATAAIQQPMQQPSVQGLPLPPIQQPQPEPPVTHYQHHSMPPPQSQQHHAYGAAPPVGAGTSAPPAAGGSKYALIHTAEVALAQKATQSGSLVLGMGQVLAPHKHAATLKAMAWPRELLIAKNIAMESAKTVIASKRGSCMSTLLKVQYASREARGFPERLRQAGAAGLVSLHGAMGVLVPLANPDSQEMMLQLVVVPTSNGSGS